MKVLIFIEHFDREYLLASRIADLLIARGYKVDILSIPFHLWSSLWTTYELIMLPFAIRDTEHPLELMKYRFPKARFVSLNFEQILHKANTNFRRPIGPVCLKDIMHCYYKEEFKTLLLSSGVDEENLVQTPHYAPVIMKQASKNTFACPANVKRVLVLSSFQWAFLDDAALEKKIASGYDKDTAYSYRAYCQRQIKEYFKLVHELSKISNVEVVWRGHPSESDEVYERLYKTEFGLSKNVVFSSKGSAYQWLLNANFVIGSWTTLLIDISKHYPQHVLRYTPETLPHFLDVDFLDDIPAQSLEDILHYVNNAAIENRTSAAILTIEKSVLSLSSSIDKILSSINDTKSHKMRVKLKISFILRVVISLARNMSMTILPAAFTRSKRRDYFQMRKIK